MAKYKVTMIVDTDGRPSCDDVNYDIQDALSGIDLYVSGNITVENYSSELQDSLEEYIGDNASFVINEVDFSGHNIQVVVYLDAERYRQEVSVTTMSLDDFLEYFNPQHFIFAESIHDPSEGSEVYLEFIGREL